MKERLRLILKRKAFYIVLTVLFSLILAADVAVAVFVPAQSEGFGRRGNDFSEMSGFPGGDTEGGEMTMPENLGFGDEEMMKPERPDSSDGEMAMPENFESGDGEMTMPEDMDPTQLQNAAQSNTGFLQTVKSHWLLIFVIFFLLDGSVFLCWYVFPERKKHRSCRRREK